MKEAALKGLVRQFRGVAYAQVLLGVIAFGVASQNLALLVGAGSLAALGWATVSGRLSPMPRPVTNLAGIAATVWLMIETLHLRNDLLLTMSHFTLWLQLILLYSHKSNREYAAMLVLSVLLMVAASVLSVSVIYGLLLAVYCVLALFSLLLFQMKVTSDRVHVATRPHPTPTTDPANQPATRPAAHPANTSAPAPAAGAPAAALAAPPAAGNTPPAPPHDGPSVAGARWRVHFRLLTFSVALVCATTAALTFIGVPRSDEHHIRSLHDSRAAAQSQAGLSNRLHLDGGAPDRGASRPVMHLEVMHDGRQIAGDRIWRLRGIPLDYYDSRSRTWRRGPGMGELDQYRDLDGQALKLSDIPDGAATYRARITPRQSRRSLVFSGHPPVQVIARDWRGVRFNPYDHQLIAPGGVDGDTYEVIWLAEPAEHSRERLAERWRMEPRDDAERLHARMGPGQEYFEFDADTYATGWNVQADRVAAFARQILQPRGLSRDPDAKPGPGDVAIARALAEHLRDQYHYTLDNPPRQPGDEPLTAFLFNHQQGHCELFASALAAMTRSLGMRARVVTGYLAQHYNQVGGYYTVRDTDAHAWVEIDAGPDLGWVTVDPTPEAVGSQSPTPARGWLTAAREMYEHLEYRWISSVVTFDQRSREALLGQVHDAFSFERQGEQEGGVLAAAVDGLRELAGAWESDVATFAGAGLVFVGLGLALLTVARLLVVRRRRLATLQLTALPRARRRGLARRLRFYLTMLDMLERHGHIRPHWQSPASFAEQLAEAQPMRFDPVVALTDHFYEIRFGHRELTPERRQRIHAHLKQLEHTLTAG